jgi:Flp pilus assembly protein CpaB
MNPWPFVIAAYAVALVGTAGLIAASFGSMRRAEEDADKLRRDGR